MIQFGFIKGLVHVLLTTAVTRAKSDAVASLVSLTTVFGPSLVSAQETTNATDRSRPLGEALTLNQLNWRAQLFGHAPSEGIELLKNQILDRYGYRTECDDSFLGHVREWNCLAGLQQLLRAFEKLGDQAQNPEFLGIEEIEIGSNWKAEGDRWEPLELKIPYTATAGDIGLWLSYHLQKNSRPADRRFMASLDEKVAAKSKDLGIEIHVNTDIDPKQIERGLALLSESITLLRSTRLPAKPGSTELKPSRLEPLFDYVILSDKNDWHREHNERTSLHFNVDQKLDRALWTLKSEFAICNPEIPADSANDFDRLTNCEESYRTAQTIKFRQARAQLQEIRKSLPAYQIYCGESNELPLEKCVTGAKGFQRVVELVKRDVLSSIKSVVITNRERVKYALRRLDLKEWLGEGDRLQMSYTADPAEVAGSIYQEMAQERR